MTRNIAANENEKGSQEVYAHILEEYLDKLLEIDNPEILKFELHRSERTIRTLIHDMVNRADSAMVHIYEMQEQLEDAEA